MWITLWITGCAMRSWDTSREWSNGSALNWIRGSTSNRWTRIWWRMSRRVSWSWCSKSYLTGIRRWTDSWIRRVCPWIRWIASWRVTWSWTRRWIWRIANWRVSWTRSWIRARSWIWTWTRVICLGRVTKRRWWISWSWSWRVRRWVSLLLQENTSIHYEKPL